MGNAATVEAMTTELVPSTQIYWEDYRQVVLTITVPEDGTYNFGFHALSEAGGSFFLVDDISVTEGLMLKAPLAVTDLKVVAGEKAAPTATVSFTTPTKAVDGSDLDALTSVQVYRDSKLVKTFDAPAAGATLSFAEENLTTEDYAVYSVVAATAAGQGAVAADSAWIGLDAPSEPTVHIAVADGHPVLTWDTPTGLGMHGGYFDPAQLTYIVYDATAGTVLASGLTGNTYTVESYTVSETGEQSMQQYGVFAMNNGDELLTGYPGSNFIIEGEKYALPFKESFAKGQTDNLLLISSTITNSTGYDKWSLDDDYNTTSQDGDGGSIMIMPATAGVQSTIQMGKIDMTTASNATLSFYLKRLAYDYDYMETNPKDDSLNVYIIDANNETHLALTIRPYDLKKNAEYEKFSLPLTQYEGADFIALQFQMNAVAAYYALVLDNIQVRSNYNVNLQTSDFKLPASVDVTRDFEATVEVTNDGIDTVRNFTVQLLKGSEVIASQVDTAALANAETRQYTFSVTALAAWADNVTIVADVTIDNDEVAADDTLSASIVILRPEVPAVTDLAVSVADEQAVFTWTAPTIATAERVTDSFEDYTHGARKDFGEWSLIDEDGAYGMNADVDISGYFSSRSFTVVNSVSVDADGYEAKSGQQLVVAFSNWDNDNDDWLVSPALSGEAQTVSFWARSNSASTDKLYFYYATDGKTTDDFLSAPALDERKIILTTTWTKYSFELPAGAKYFAIRYLTSYGDAALVDDIEFEKASSYNVQPVIEGYNLYNAQGEKLNDETITDTTYTLNNATGIYYITVVYNVGESANSNQVSVTASGIETIATDAQKVQSAYDLYGRRVQKLQNGQLYIRDGKKVAY
jgi:hypothetical protein